MKLYEVALSMPIRMRLNPTLTQVVQDTITNVDDIFAHQGVTTDSCIDFINKMRYAIDLHAYSQRKLVKELGHRPVHLRVVAFDYLVRWSELVNTDQRAWVWSSLASGSPS